MVDDNRSSDDSRPSRLHPASCPPEPRTPGRGGAGRGDCILHPNPDAGRREVALEETVRQGAPPLDDPQWHLCVRCRES